MTKKTRSEQRLYEALSRISLDGNKPITIDSESSRIGDFYLIYMEA